MAIDLEILPDSPPQVGVTVDGLAASSVISIERSWDGVTFYGVRGAQSTLVTGSAFFRDFLPPLNVLTTYRCRINSGSMTTRRNIVTDPRATTAARWSANAGTGGVTTETMVTGAVDGPTLPDGTKAATYARYTWTTASTGGVVSALFDPVNATSNIYPVGTPFGLSIYVRPSFATTLSAQGATEDTTGAATFMTLGTGTSCPANVWTRLSTVSVSTVAGGAVRVYAVNNNLAVPLNGKIDVTCAMVEEYATTVGSYFDGALGGTGDLIYGWEGTANASISDEFALEVTATITIPSSVAWLQDPIAPHNAVAIAVSGGDDTALGLTRNALTSYKRGQAVDLATVQGASMPVASVGTRQKPSDIPIEFEALAAEQGALVNSLRDLFDSAGQVAIRGLPDELGIDAVAHVVAPEITESPIVGASWPVFNRFTMTVTQTRPSSLQIVVPWWTYDQVKQIVADGLGVGATYAAVLGAIPGGTTYIDAQRDPTILGGP